MACYKPLTAYRTDGGDIHFHDNGQGRPLELPCGQCIGCRIQRSKDWALRCVHEASMYEDNCFITLTYGPEKLPPDCGLIKSDFQKFMKRLRNFLEVPATLLNDDCLTPKIYMRGPKKGLRKIGTFTGTKIKYYMCGEYGDESNRPHYHAIIFNWNPDDWVYLFDSPGGEPVYTSPTLESIWGLGFVTIGTVTFESAAYVARYVLKKINGPLAEKIDEKTGLKHYERINSFTGEISEVIPEYNDMSRRPGIGINWISNYTRDVYPKDYTTVRGVKQRPPRYYDNYLMDIDPEMYDDIKAARELSMSENFAENTELRLKQREKVAEAQNKQLVRSL